MTTHVYMLFSLCWYEQQLILLWNWTSLEDLVLWIHFLVPPRWICFDCFFFCQVIFVAIKTAGDSLDCHWWYLVRIGALHRHFYICWFNFTCAVMHFPYLKTAISWIILCTNLSGTEITYLEQFELTSSWTSHEFTLSFLSLTSSKAYCSFISCLSIAAVVAASWAYVINIIDSLMHPIQSPFWLI